MWGVSNLGSPQSKIQTWWFLSHQVIQNFEWLVCFWLTLSYGYIFGALSFLYVGSHTRFPTWFGSVPWHLSLPQKIEVGSDFLRLGKFHQAKIIAMSTNLGVHLLLWPGISLLNCLLSIVFEDLCFTFYPAHLLVFISCSNNAACCYLNTDM